MSASPRELFDRVRQECAKRIDTSLAPFGYRFVSDRLISEPVRKTRFFFSSDQVPRLTSLLRERLPQQAERIVQQAEKICAHRFDLLGYGELDFGEPINWHYDPVHGKQAPRKPFYRMRYLDFEEVGDSKIIWELNRHQHFVTLAKAFWLTGEERFALEAFRQWSQWQTENPYPIGINWASSLEVSFRSLSWLWMYFLLQNSGTMPASFRKDWLRAQALNGRYICRYLSTYFSPNTHLLGEAVALFFLGVLFPELRSAGEWKQRGWEIILQEGKRQVRADGFHFEQSTYYHVYAVDFFLHATILASVNDLNLPSDFQATLEKMLEALFVLSRSGLPPGFGDDDGGRVFDPGRNLSEHMLDPLATGAVLFGRGDFKFTAGDLREETVWLLGEQGLEEWDRITVVPPKQDSASLASSGFYVMPQQVPKCQLVVDAGPLGALAGGHGHADALTICVSTPDRHLLVDSGTFEYIGEGAERNLLRGTGAHNTLRVDGAGQADVDGPFSWTNLPNARAEQWIQGETFDLFVGSHDGFRRLAEPVVHQRWIFSLKGHFWMVRDLAIGEGQHRLELTWHLGPEMQLQDESIFGARNGEERIGILTADGHGWSMEGHKDWWSPCYGRKQPNLVLTFGNSTRLPAEFVTLLAPLQERSAKLGKLIACSSTPLENRVRGYIYATPDATHAMFFAKEGEPWRSDGWASDAAFLYSKMDHEQQIRHVIFCHGSWVDFEEKHIVNCARKVSRCELLMGETKIEVFSSDPESVTVQHPLSGSATETPAEVCDENPAVPDPAE